MTTTAQPTDSPAAARTGRLRVHTSERADVLVDALAAVLAADPPSDPFAAEVVAVPTRGVERWVAQRLSHRLGALGGVAGEAGVCANVDFDSPTRVLHRVVASASGIDPDADPWDRERLAWHVLRAVDAAVEAGEPWASPLARFLTDPPGPAASDGVRVARRMRLAQRVAALFAAYGSQRPSVVASWADGVDDDGAGAPLPGDLAWQPPLWRAVREAAGVPSPAERLVTATAVLRDDPDVVGLPARLSVFGPTRLPEGELDVLAALAAHREVHLWLPHPSPVLWERATVPAAGRSGPAPRRAAVASTATHPLLGSLGRDATELSLRLAARGVDVAHHPAPPPQATVLGTLQSVLRTDERPAPDERVAAARTDRSIQVHACHGRSRQVEVLREVVVGLLADDPTLEPRDVVVLCPDVEAFAPLVTATFGAASAVTDESDPHPGRTLRVRIADRSPARTNPLLRVVSDLLALAGSRVTASAVVDLAGLDAVRRRFRFDDADLERLRAWVLESGVRWGEDAGRRSRFGVRVGQGTWSAAMDRLLLGVAMSDDEYRHLDATLPLDDVGSTDVDLAGRFAELVDRVTGLLAELDGSRPASAWFDALDRALVLLADTAPADQWQRVEARGVLADARAAAGARGDGGASSAASPAGGAPLRLPDVVALLERRLAGRPTRAGFRTGALTVCSLEPMRAVPHRVVCLLGMDDTAFPRVGAPSGDDVLAREPLVGERDRRSEDRQLFLDAVLAATDHLVVVHSGADERTGRTLPPSVPVGELLDAVDECAVFPAGPGAPGGATPDARSALVVHHPLQTVDERNFVPGALGRRGPFSFDDLERRAALVGRAPRSGPTALLEAPLPPAPDDGATVDLDGTTGLVPTLEHPVRAFVRGRLGVTLPRDQDDVEDRLPLELDGLDGWAAGDRILTAVLDGTDVAVAASAERLRGRMPPGLLGSTALHGIVDNVTAVAAAAAPFARTPAATLDVTAALPDGRTLVGTVPGARGDDGQGYTVTRALYSRLGAKHRLRAWVQLLALAASGIPVTSAVTIGRGQGRRPSAAARRLVAPGRDEAAELLAGLVAVRDLALREPLPLPVDQAERYASRRADGEEAAVLLRDLDDGLAADRRYRDDDEYHVLAWGDGWRLTAVAGTPSEAERTLAPDEPTRFGVLARAVWAPLLAHERTEGPA